MIQIIEGITACEHCPVPSPYRLLETPLEAVIDLRVNAPHVAYGKARKPYPSDVSDEEWTLVAPYLTLLPEDAGQQDYPLHEAFNGLRYIIKTGA